MSIANKPEYINKVVPMDQSFDKDYCGIFHFKFWKYGRWYDIVIDDQLPVDRYTEKLFFCHNKNEPKEFWSSLLEKAYAKIASCYEYLQGGLLQDSLIDLTGGLDQVYSLNGIRPNTPESEKLWNVMMKAFKMKSLITSAIYIQTEIYGSSSKKPNFIVAENEIQRRNGLVEGHAYSILKLCEFNDVKVDIIERSVGFGASKGPYSQTVRLIRVKNPWNNESEWKGKYSDKSPEWHKVPAFVLEKLNLTKNDDGEFW